jgi:hypothetical protein
MSMRYKGGVISATPPTTSTTSASGSWTLQQQMQATAAGNWPTNGPFNYIEDVFSTWLYTGNGSTQTITNGIDLAGKGGLVWIKDRVATPPHLLIDTIRGGNKYLSSNTTNAQSTQSIISAFNTTGFSLTADTVIGDWNWNGDTYASWTFREQPKFFDVVTYTGNGTSQAIAHNLGSVPGCIIVKDTSNVRAWSVYHTSLGNTQNLILSGTNAAATAADWNNTSPTTTQFTVGNNVRTNASGATYVAYLFAHNAGGFGLTGTDNVISCGSFTTDGSGAYSVTLGYEPQWVLIKRTNALGDWFLFDNMRGMPVGSNDSALRPNTSGAETQAAELINPSATGFYESTGSLGASQTFIYIAIRRGPMKVPTTGTSVFEPFVNGATTTPGYVTSFPPDFCIAGEKSGTDKWYAVDRLRGAVRLNTASTAAEASQSSVAFYQNGAFNQDWQYGYNSWVFRRAPGFFDEVCYTGNGATQTLTHNLGVVPELIIGKRRDADSSTGWIVYASPLANASTSFLVLNLTDAVGTGNTIIWNSTAPTSTVFSLGASSNLNTSGSTNVAYLFASAPGVSKVGSYTGTGTTQTINCGFTGGARFVLIKATSTTGNWLVWDTARGMIPSNDPYLALNSTAAEVTGTDWVDTAATGFELSNAGGNLANSSGVSYIFLAIA